MDRKTRIRIASARLGYDVETMARVLGEPVSTVYRWCSLKNQCQPRESAVRLAEIIANERSQQPR